MIWLPAGVAVAVFMAFGWWAAPLVRLASLATAKTGFLEEGVVELPSMHAMVSAFGQTIQSAIVGAYGAAICRKAWSR